MIACILDAKTDLPFKKMLKHPLTAIIMTNSKREEQIPLAIDKARFSTLEIFAELTSFNFQTTNKSNKQGWLVLKQA